MSGEGAKHYQLQEVGGDSFSADVGYPVDSQRGFFSSKSKRMYALAAVGLVVLIFLAFYFKQQYDIKMTDNDNHRHDGRTFSYPTVGIPVPGQTYNATKVAGADLIKFDQAFLEIFKPYNDTDCEYARYGDNLIYGGEGGYLVCKNWIQHSQGMINIGINGFDDFGCKVTAVGGFINEQYDCINPTETPCPQNGNQNHMHKVCFGTTNEEHYGQTYQTFEAMLRETHLENKYVFMKIDCEGCAYPGLKYLPTNLLDKVDQIVGEFHLGHIYKEEWGMLDIFRTLADKFVVVNLHMTNFACFEEPHAHRKLEAAAVQYTLVNKRLITKKSESRSFVLHPLNKPNLEGGRDCQISDV